MSSSIEITFVKDSTGDPVLYELEVKNFCTDATIENVLVKMDGVSMGYTDSDGIISLGYLIPGSKHTIEMSADGFMNSDEDHLNNDSFTVPESSDDDEE